MCAFVSLFQESILNGRLEPCGFVEVLYCMMHTDIHISANALLCNQQVVLFMGVLCH